MKNVIYFLKLTGLLVLCFLCIFFFLDLFLLLGLNEGIQTLQVAGIWLGLLFMLGVVYKKSNRFNSIFEPLRKKFG